MDVLVVGAGPAGLTAAAALAASGAGAVEVLEREREAGGVPRHCDRGGFGTRELWRPMTGPDYARHRTRAAVRAGAALRTGVMVTGWAGPLTVEATSRAGPEEVTARAVVLATGARERPRSARLVPGDRPEGVWTTGELQQVVHLHGRRVGGRALIVGAGPVARATVGTLRKAGAEPVALVTDGPGPAPRPALRRAVPVLTDTVVTELIGRGRLTGVALRRADGRVTVVRCDSVVFTGDFVPEHELVRSAGIALDPGTRGPSVDAYFRTARPGVFAVGNVLHGAEPAATAASEGGRAAERVRRFLADRRWPAVRVPVVADGALRWTAPNLLVPRDSGVRLLLRAGRRVVRPVVTVSQDGRTLYRDRLSRPADPERSVPLTGPWADGVDGAGGPVRIRLDETRDAGRW
ncbi:FAD-dependent oxidoreductase [Streptomyces chengbuensis]|uniref:NAD(P)/FAD-dependent oxidoreductase n=1 Tax=Streptomyces TaxID=1883 RepID=UPI0025B2C5F2|nr:FAD-dependent oxidoreductase [Streptomyces sp. HUAS CB01]WJY48810.1 FAD-dependent oxidoreductase [Streptomyces sp. HUAS CB01]